GRMGLLQGLQAVRGGIGLSDLVDLPPDAVGGDQGHDQEDHKHRQAHVVLYILPIHRDGLRADPTFFPLVTCLAAYPDYHKDFSRWGLAGKPRAGSPGVGGPADPNSPLVVSPSGPTAPPQSPGGGTGPHAGRSRVSARAHSGTSQRPSTPGSRTGWRSS